VIERAEGGDDLAWAVVEFGGVRRKVCVDCVPESRPGDYVLVHAGIAICRIDAEEAQRVFEYLKQSGERDEWDEESSPFTGKKGDRHILPG
jgi:hydrogenase expression/formation protein HypC